MENYNVTKIGTVRTNNDDMRIELEKQFIPALKNITGFGYLNILWWCNKNDSLELRGNLVEKSPYKNSPEELGVFATRSPMRPNPIGLTCSFVTYIDEENGIIGLAYIDADDNTPVLDIKPYTPSLDRVESPIVPDWCKTWPKNVETSGDFDWATVFNF